MGYKDANNGRALGALASLRYYGLVERHSNGLLSVTKDVENYKFAPTGEMSRAYLRRFLAAPPIFAELLDRYSSGLPSDGNLRYELIQRDFLPSTAESLVGIFRRSAEFAQALGQRAAEEPGPQPVATDEEEEVAVQVAQSMSVANSRAQPPKDDRVIDESSHDRIPVRLSGGRRAWLLIPHEFHEADKARLKAQIDLLLTEDEEL
ncbi:hypothetical protein [Variovorax sp. OV329]|uniref:hypothetical protein n=1 Tax=Variovorax sp. OV329 TaxID=1882825 RepID=UPI0015876C30|nr:hypothetical protein [Variovorax sp. OV329]